MNQMVLIMGSEGGPKGGPKALNEPNGFDNGVRKGGGPKALNEPNVWGNSLFFVFRKMFLQPINYFILEFLFLFEHPFFLSSFF